MITSRVARAGLTLGLLILAAAILLPILWGFATSLKLDQDIDTYPPQFIPSPATLTQYVAVLHASDMTTYFRNSVIVVLFTVATTLLIASPAGYAAARFDFPGKNAILFTLLGTMMLPETVVLIPLYMMASRLGLHDTLAVLVLVYTAWRIPMVLWIMKGFFEAIPPEIEEAALVDGCSRLQVLYRVVAPISRPGLAAAGILIFVYAWNEFIISLTLTSSNRLIPVGLYMYVTGYGIEWGKLLASAMVALIPAILWFLLLQRGLIRGLTSGAIK